MPCQPHCVLTFLWKPWGAPSGPILCLVLVVQIVPFPMEHLSIVCPLQKQITEVFQTGILPENCQKRGIQPTERCENVEHAPW